MCVCSVWMDVCLCVGGWVCVCVMCLCVVYVLFVVVCVLWCLCVCEYMCGVCV